MFKIINVEQGSEDWFKARLGLLTASNASKILTAGGKPSASIKPLINRAVAELLTGKKEDTFKSDAMQRGNDLESSALDFINFSMGYDFKEVGFMDSGLGYGASPDALDQSKRVGLELKCPLASTQVEYLITKKIPNNYMMQIQMSLLVSNYEKWIFCSYHPDLNPFIVEVERDEVLIGLLRCEIERSCQEIKKKYDLLKE